MKRWIPLLVLTLLAAIGGGVLGWTGEVDPVAVEVPVTSDTPLPGDVSFEEAEEEEAVDSDRLLASTQQGVVRSASITAATRRAVPPVPPPR